MKKKLLFWSLLVTLNGIFAQTWTNVGPGGGFFKEFVIHPTNPLIIYVGSDDAGGVWKSQDGGNTWRLLTGNYPNFTGWHIEMDLEHPDTLYFCELYGRHGILKTVDGGETLDHQTVGFILNRDFHTTQLAIFPGAGDTLFVSTGEGDDDGRIGNGIFKSFNGGESWIYSGLQDTSVHCVEILPTGRIFAGTDRNGLYYSDDLGETWEQHPDIPDTASVLNWDFKNNVFVVSGSIDGVFLSFNFGLTFENIGVVGEFNFDLAILSTSPHIEIISTGYFHPNYFTSETLLWTPIDDPMLEDQLLIGIDGDEDLIFAGIFSSTEILKSTDRGATWVPLLQNPNATEIRAVVVDVESDRIYVSLQNSYSLAGDRYNKEVLAISNDNGLTWARTGPLAHGLDLVMDPTEPQRLYLATFAQGLFKTENGFESWSAIRPGNKLISAVAIDPINSSVLLLSELDISLIESGVFKSIDGGDSWYQTGTFLATKICYNNLNDEVYFGTENGIYQSNDKGETISESPSFLEGENVISLLYYSAYLFAGTIEGELYQIDAAGTIVNISGEWNTPRPTEVRNLLIAGESLIVGLNGAEQDTLHNLNGGIWMRSLFGGAWTEITGNLTNTNIFGNTGIAVANDGQIWVATYGQSLFKSDDLVLAVPENKLMEHNFKIYPNPTNSVFLIELDPTLQCSGIKVLNTLGELVIQREMKSEKMLELDISNLPTGTYFIHFETNQGIIIEKTIIF